MQVKSRIFTKRIVLCINCIKLCVFSLIVQNNSAYLCQKNKMASLIINPTMLTFITTYTCTSACKSCCFQCSPKRKEKLSIDEMKRYIDVSVESYNSLKIMVLTGGEAFIYGKKIEDIARHAVSKGLMTRIVSNGFWAKNYDTAYKRIENLIKAGLTEINFSTGDDHLEFVPIETIKNGVLASLRQGLTVVINVESGSNRKFDSKFLLEDSDFKEYLTSRKLMIVSGLWIPFTQSEEDSVESSETNKGVTVTDSYTRCQNLFSGITIDPNHRLLACCGMTSKHIAYLDLGDVRQYSIKDLYESQFSDFMKIWLATEGAHKIMDFIATYTDMDDNYKTEHNCQVCEKILSNPQYLQILKGNYRNIYSNVLLKYFINRKELHYENEKT